MRGCIVILMTRQSARRLVVGGRLQVYKSMKSRIATPARVAGPHAVFSGRSPRSFPAPVRRPCPTLTFPRLTLF